ncbi:MAG: hypothetical protein QF831_05435 [Candidatus Thalassarchaeaceae archaeon]|jgi:hypothetical protein|nr:hypothetical protein [Candidatus Thalassarchaeaceae archaeon]
MNHPKLIDLFGGTLFHSIVHQLIIHPATMVSKLDILYVVAIIFLIIGYFLGQEEMWVDAAICSISSVVLLFAHSWIKKRMDSRAGQFSTPELQQQEVPQQQIQYTPATQQPMMQPSQVQTEASRVCQHCGTPNHVSAIHCSLCMMQF